MTNKKAAPSKPGDRFPTENSQSVNTPSAVPLSMSTPPALDAESAEVLAGIKALL